MKKLPTSTHGALVLLALLAGCSSGQQEDLDAGRAEPTATSTVVEPLVVSGGWWLTDRNFPGQTKATAPGDFDGDGKDDLLLCRMGIGCGTVGFDAYNRMRANLVQSAGAGMGAGASFAFYMGVKAVADFTGDGLADAIIENEPDVSHSNLAPNQQFLLTRDAGTYGFRGLAVAPLGSLLTGGFIMDSLDQAMAVGDFDRDGRKDVLTMGTVGASNHGIATISSSPAGSFYASTMQASGTLVGHWNHGPGDVVLDAGDVDNDGQSDLAIESVWGIGVLTRDPVSGKLKDLAMAANGANLGNGFTLKEGRIVAFGNFDSDPADEVVLQRTCLSCSDYSKEYAIADVDVTTGTFKVITWAAAGTMTSGGWRLGGLDNINPGWGNRCVDYDGDGIADFIVTSPWGIGVLTLGTFMGGTFPAVYQYKAFKTLAGVPWNTNVGGNVFTHALDTYGQPGRYMGLGRYLFAHLSATELAFIGVGPSGFETLARATLDHEDPPPATTPPPPQPPPPTSTSCSKSSYQFCWRNTAGGAVPAAVLACSIDAARSVALPAGQPGGYAACPECLMFDGACPAPACTSGTPTYAEMCCPGTGTTYVGRGCSLSEAQSFAKKGDLGCTGWYAGTCHL